MIRSSRRYGRHPGRLRWVLACCILLALTASRCDRAQSANAADEAPGWFTDVTTEVGLDGFIHITGAAGNKWMPETMGGGGGFLDYDGDGWLDILLVRGSDWPQEGAQPVPALALFKNNGNGTFTDRTSEAGLDSVHAYAFGVTAADIDNDGDVDIYLTALNSNMLFENRDGVFVERGEAAGVAGPSEWSSAAVFFDADRDGFLDLFVGNYVEWTPEIDQPCSLAGGIRSYCTPELYDGVSARFYHNNGDGSFTERTEQAGFGSPAPGKTLAAGLIDYNGDEWTDLIVVNDMERDLLYENNGDGTFTERGIISGIAYDVNGKARAGMGVDVGVIDSTGMPTVFVANFAREMVGAYQYRGNGTFTDRARQLGIARASVNYLTFGLFVFDADLDGHLDLFTANGHISPEIGHVDGVVSYKQPARLYRNGGDGMFEVLDPAGEAGVWNQRIVGRGAAYGDYDRDGDPDILLMENGGPARLWRNERREVVDGPTSTEVRHVPAHAGAGGSFLRVVLEGRESNRDGIGARVTVTANRHRMVRYVRTGSSYLSHSETTLTFGLGTAAMVDSLVVYWPSSHVDTFTQIPGNQEMRIVEGSSDPESVARTNQNDTDVISTSAAPGPVSGSSHVAVVSKQ